MEESRVLWQPLADLLSNFQRCMNGLESRAVSYLQLRVEIILSVPSAASVLEKLTCP